MLQRRSLTSILSMTIQYCAINPWGIVEEEKYICSKSLINRKCTQVTFPFQIATTFPLYI